MKPSIGRIVHVLNGNRGDGVANAAIITRVWSDAMVNVTVFPDTEAPKFMTSVKLVGDEDTARGISDGAEHPQTIAFWPPRV